VDEGDLRPLSGIEALIAVVMMGALSTDLVRFERKCRISPAGYPVCVAAAVLIACTLWFVAGCRGGLIDH